MKEKAATRSMCRFTQQSSAVFQTEYSLEVQVYLFVKQIAFLGEPEMISEIKYPVGTIISTIVENVIRSFATRKGMEELEKLLNK